MNYNEAMGYLKKLTKFGFNMGLERVTELLRRLGDPHLSLRVIHVGGTNGKGSTTAMLGSILSEAGYKTATFTSPHLHCYTERYAINGRCIDRERLAGLLSGIRPHLDSMLAEGFEHPTEFEVGTALGLLYFYEEGVDLAVIEVGMGGAIDSTNVVRPLVSVITNVSMDHMNYLGHGVAEIARVKAGIIKQNTPLVTGARGEALEILMERCREKSSIPVLVGSDVNCGSPVAAPDMRGQIVTITGRLGKYENLLIPLLGWHQVLNTATAVAVVEILMEKGFNISRPALGRGLGLTRWPARFEIYKGCPPVVLDGAHNFEGAVSLSRTLREYFPGREVVLLLGMLDDKERNKVVAELAAGAAAVIVTKPDSPRAVDWRGLAVEAAKYVKEVYEHESVPEAIKAGLGLSCRDRVLCIAGSLYMVAEAQALLPAVMEDFNKTPCFGKK